MTRDEIYQEKLRPLLDQICDLAVAHDIPYLMAFQVDYDSIRECPHIPEEPFTHPVLAEMRRDLMYRNKRAEIKHNN